MEPTPEEIRDQLDRVLLSPGFCASERLADFLRFVVDETLAGRAAEINQRTVGVKGLGYPSSFDPQTNPAVRVHARRLRQVLDRYYLTQGVADPIRIKIPRGGYVPIFSPNSAPPQNAELRAEPATELEPSAATTDPPLAHPSPPSIAVLQMEFLGGDEEYAYLGNGLTEEIVIALTRFPEFLVVGPLRGDIVAREHLGPHGVGRKYRVRFVLDGTVRVRGPSLRITAKLNDALSGHQLWGQAYHHDLETTTIGQIENEIVSQVVAAIADSFGVIPRALAKESFAHQNDTLSDYEAVLRFYHHVRTVTEESLTEAITALEETVQRDPNHDLAVALLGDLVAGPYSLGYVDDKSVLERAAELGQRAVALNPSSQPAHFVMAEVYFLTFQRGPCLAEIEQVLDLNPNNANYLALSALFLASMGEWERGVGLMCKAMRLNPHHPGWYHLVPFMYHYRQGAYEGALLDARRFNTPGYYLDPLIRAAVLGQLGRQEEAKQAVAELLALLPDFKSRGRSVLKRMVHLDENVDMLLEGLRKAGLETSG
jgi:adenylate cyclase